MSDFKKGDKVRLSAEGLKQLRPRKPHRTGTVIYTYGCKYASVMWHGLKSSYSYDLVFLELVQEDEPLPPEIARKFAHVEITPDDQ